MISPFGNHARFIDATHRVDEQLTETIDAICRQILDFIMGVWMSVTKAGMSSKPENILPSSKSPVRVPEPTHIYDPKHSLFFAWKEIVRHWIILNRISRQTRRKYQYCRAKGRHVQRE